MASVGALKSLVASFKRNVAYYSCPRCQGGSLEPRVGRYGLYIYCRSCFKTFSDTTAVSCNCECGGC